MSSPREQLEQEVQRLCGQGQHALAAETSIRGYGPEVFGALMATLRNEAAAEEVFSVWSERLWRGLAGFTWGCTLRTWAYILARNACTDFRRHEHHRARLDQPLPDSEVISGIAHQVRSETQPYLRTDAKDRLSALRERLPPEDRELLVLRLDRQLEWKELALVMLGREDVARDALTRESQRLRKRFQLLKDELVELGRREGLFLQE
ncbi:RNA polymerase sigma factor [Myxococcus sp. Y35]|uniref:RNA polymerase sigma factor n=1 Tax=Pseudomyxococcus flavus TaxID=3115648 RepID=UPI003CE8B4E7